MYEAGWHGRICLRLQVFDPFPPRCWERSVGPDSVESRLKSTLMKLYNQSHVFVQGWTTHQSILASTGGVSD